MWHWRHKNGHKKYTLWFKLLALSSGGHLLLLMCCFFFYHESTVALNVTASRVGMRNHEPVYFVGEGQKKGSGATAVKSAGVLSGTKASKAVQKVAPKPGPKQTGNTKSSQKTIEKKKIASEVHKKQESKKQPVTSDAPKVTSKITANSTLRDEAKKAAETMSPGSEKKIAQKVPEAFQKKTSVASVSEKRAQEKTVKNVVLKKQEPVVAAKPAAVPKPVVASHVKSEIAPKSVPESKSVPEPVQESKSPVLQLEPQVTPKPELSSVSNDMPELLTTSLAIATGDTGVPVTDRVSPHDRLRQELGCRWQPPIGVTVAQGCVVRVCVDQEGNAGTVEMVSSSGVLMFDISVQTVCHTQRWPSWVRGREVSLSFS